MSELELVEHPQPPSDGPAWSPYEEDPGFTRQWWHRRLNLVGSYSVWSVYDGSREIARVQLSRAALNGGYLEVPHLGSDVRAVEYFEVASGKRGNGSGAAALSLIANRFPRSRLVAFSNEAAGFWARLGWDRYDHPNGSPRNWPFFVAPKGWPAG